MTLATKKSDFLGKLLAPIPVEHFFKKYWEKELLLVSRSSPWYFRDIATVEDFDRILSSVRIPMTHFNLAKDVSPLPISAYSNGSDVDMQRVMKCHRKGATIILRSFHEWCAPLQRLRRQAEQSFRCPAQVNVYLTPPENQSTPPHWDTHDLFILQLEGSKKWRIYDSPRTLPLQNEHFKTGVDRPGELIHEFTLYAGDFLYLPRGTIHEPQSVEYSIHASIGVPVVTWQDMMINMINIAAKNNVELRRSLPIQYGEGLDLAKIQASMDDILQLMGNQDIADKSVEDITQRFIETRESDVAGQLLSIARPPRLSVDTVVEQRHGICHRKQRDTDRIYLQWRDRTISVPLHLEPILDFIAHSGRFRIRDLPSELSDQEKIAIVSTMIDENLLVECNDTD